MTNHDTTPLATPTPEAPILATSTLEAPTREAISTEAPAIAMASPATFGPGQPGPAPAPQDAGASFAITSFVLGIASIVSSWTFIAPIIGLVFGVLALRRQTRERTLALWGVWLNGAMLALTVLVVLGMMLLVGLGILAGAPYWSA
ncbi:DUF4190 domain-containing protein [Leucobacter soli]|nr:DUF4190 domain-containing protein [Leucobacter soli]